MSLGKWKRRGLIVLSYPLSKKRAKQFHHWIEGYRAVRRLRQADAVFVSLPKSGRTWLRVMLCRFYQQRFGLSENALEDLEGYHSRNGAIPYLFFTHEDHLRHYLKQDDPAEIYAGKKVVLLVRDPRDGAVSMYFQWKYRTAKSKKFFFNHGDREFSVEEFVLGAPGHRGTIHRRINILNRWGQATERLSEMLVVRYEDLRRDPAEWLARVLAFVGTPGTAEEIEDAVTFASFENMRAREVAADSGVPNRLRPGQSNVAESFKTRRGRVGGFRDYFDRKKLRRLDAIVTSRLDPIFGYGNRIREPVNGGGIEN